MMRTSPMQGFQRLAQEFTSQGHSLGRLWRRRSLWQVRLRWAVPPAILLCAGGASALGFRLNWLPLLVVAGGILAYNTVIAAVSARIRSAPQQRESVDLGLTAVQVSLDYAALLALLHFTGGLASPLLFFLIFHVIIAAMLFRPSTAYAFAATASLATAGLTVCEFAGVLPSHPVWFDGHTLNLAQRPGHLLAVLLFFSAAMFITAAVSNMIMGHLRERVMALAEVAERAAALNDKLASLYVMVEAVSAQKVLDRVLQTVVKELTKVTEVAGITVKLLSEDGQTLRYAAVHGLPPGFGADRVLELSRSPFNRRVVEGEALVVGQLEQQHRFQLRGELLAAGIQSVMLAPLRVQQRVIGVLGAYRREAEQFGDEDLGFFQLAAELVAIAIDDARQADAIDRLMEERTRLMLQVAHNLRAPLSAASTMLDTLGGGYLGSTNAQQGEYLERIGRRLHAMRETIGELLVLANARRLDPTAKPAPVALGELISEVAEMFRSEAARKQLRLQATAAAGLPPVWGSAELLRQLVENLLSNSIKYTPAGGTVTATLTAPEGKELMLEVRDTGIGIPESEQGRLFTEFFRASNAREFEPVGTGLGLALVEQIARRHKGAIRVESAVGQGTRVLVTLPGSQEASMR